jgi:antitoxin HicB
LEENNLKPQPPSDIKSIQCDANSFASLVSVNVNLYRRKTKPVKKTLTIPEWLNIEAEKKHINFSSVLQEALKERLGL